MSTNTLVFGLFEYDAETDGNLPFNITQALNNNWNKIDSLVLPSAAVAAPYNPSGTYNVGDYCIYNGTLQKCNTPIPSGEPWNAEHWTETSVSEELTKVTASLANKAEWNGGFLQNVSILEWAENRGANSINTHVSTNETVTDMPYNSFWAVDFKSYPDGGWIELFATDIQNGKTWINIKNGQQPWSGWIPIPIATPPQEYSLPLAEGITENQPCTYYKNQFNEVTIHFNGQGTITEAMLLGTLPEGFRPAKIYDIPAVYRTADGYHAGGIVLWTDGTITTHISIPSAIGCIFSASFIATR